MWHLRKVVDIVRQHVPGRTGRFRDATLILPLQIRTSVAHDRALLSALTALSIALLTLLLRDGGLVPLTVCPVVFLRKDPPPNVSVHFPFWRKMSYFLPIVALVLSSLGQKVAVGFPKSVCVRNFLVAAALLK